jgi:glucokinase
VTLKNSRSTIGTSPCHVAWYRNQIRIPLGDCVCGNRGCGETVASASALIAAAQGQGLEVAEALEVFEAEARGDDRAAVAVRRFLDGLATIVVNAIHAYRPEVVVLAGGVMGRSDRILPQLRAAVAERAWMIPPGSVQVVASTLGPSGPVMGAAAIAFQERG